VPDPADLPDPAPAQPVGDPSAAQPEREAAVARRLLETELRLREATLDVYQSLGLFPNRDLQYAVSDAAGIPGNTGVQPPWYQQNTKRGEVIPVYRTEQELRLIQDRMRVICNYNEFAICALENRVNYVVGDGFTYSATAKDPHNKAHQKSADAVQVVIDRWCEINDSSALEAEALWRMDTEGEAIIRGFRGKDGYIHQRFVEPEHVRPPTADTADPVNSFGVITKRDDIQTVEGYWIVNDPLNNPLPVRVSADKVLHLKLNVRSTAKRGLPTFFPVEANLRRCEDLLASMTSVAKARAKIALIRKITGLTSATADSLLSKLSAVRANDPATGETLNIERLRYGTVLTASGNTEYQMPSVQLGASDIVEVLQAELRAVASRLQMPEWMFTALADAKYSNAFIVEAPTLKCFRRLQRPLRNGFGLCRYGHRKSLVWRQLEAAVEAELITRDDLDNVTLSCEGPVLEARDRMQEVERQEKLVAARFSSKETAQRALELDPDVEQPLIKSEQIGNARPPADLNAIAQIQEAFYAGKLPRDAAAANLMILARFTREQAAELLPASDCVKRTDDGQQPGMPGQPGAAQPGAGGPSPGAGPDDATPPAPGGSGEPASPADDLAAQAMQALGVGAGSSGAGAAPTPEQLREVYASTGRGTAGFTGTFRVNFVPHRRRVAALREAGFTGVVTASNGVVYHYVDGKRVKGEEHAQHVAQGGQPSPVIKDPDPKQFAGIIHLIGEHVASGEADWIDANKAIDKVLKKYGGGQEKWQELASLFNFDTGGKKSQSAMLTAIKKDIEENGVMAGLVAAAKGEEKPAADEKPAAAPQPSPEQPEPTVQDSAKSIISAHEEGLLSGAGAYAEIQHLFTAAPEGVSPGEVLASALGMSADELNEPGVLDNALKQKLGLAGPEEPPPAAAGPTPDEQAAELEHVAYTGGKPAVKAALDAMAPETLAALKQHYGLQDIVSTAGLATHVVQTVGTSAPVEPPVPTGPQPAEQAAELEKIATTGGKPAVQAALGAMTPEAVAALKQHYGAGPGVSNSALAIAIADTAINGPAAKPPAAPEPPAAPAVTIDPKVNPAKQVLVSVSKADGTLGVYAFPTMKAAQTFGQSVVSNHGVKVKAKVFGKGHFADVAELKNAIAATVQKNNPLTGAPNTAVSIHHASDAAAIHAALMNDVTPAGNAAAPKPAEPNPFLNAPATSEPVYPKPPEGVAAYLKDLADGDLTPDQAKFGVAGELSKMTSGAYGELATFHGAPDDVNDYDGVKSLAKKLVDAAFTPAAAPPAAAPQPAAPPKPAAPPASAPNVAPLPADEKLAAAAKKTQLGSPTGYKPADATAAPADPKVVGAKTAGEVAPAWAVMNNLPPQKQRYGACIVRTDPATGKQQVLLVEPKNHYDGEVWVFPKGQHDQATPGQTAVKEAGEEAGHNVELTGALPQPFDSAGATKYAYFVAKSTGENPALMDQETASTKWVDIDKAHELLSQSTKLSAKERNLKVLDALKQHLATGATDDPKIAEAVAKLNDRVHGLAELNATPVEVASSLKQLLSEFHPHAVEQIAAKAVPGGTAANLVEKATKFAQENKGLPSLANIKNLKKIGEGSTGAKVGTVPPARSSSSRTAAAPSTGRNRCTTRSRPTRFTSSWARPSRRRRCNRPAARRTRSRRGSRGSRSATS
jgi:ADP-ribose pyrophosphatase YjhB (NUDIX family)